MKKVAIAGLGAVLLVAGVTFGLQGLGLIGGSAMSGKTVWAVIGPVLALIGAGVAVAGLRGDSRVPSGAGSHRKDEGSAGSEAVAP